MRQFAIVTGVQRDNPDAAYHGLTVGPKDRDKVLLRWNLEDGRYQVIYGNLRSDVVSKDELDKLESRQSPLTEIGRLAIDNDDADENEQ